LNPFCESGPGFFEDVAVCFIDEEGVLLDPDQTALRKEVMEENCGRMDSLGKAPCSSMISVLKCNIPTKASVILTLPQLTLNDLCAHILPPAVPFKTRNRLV
uniref:KRAB domain-containing protein n=1 Tax=Podarcis muralis TaxID=64176 RepID=A0A670JA10_PODMU